MSAPTPERDSTSPAPSTGGLVVSNHESGARRQPRSYPTRWQMKMLWMAITGVSLLTLGALTVLVIILSGRVLGYLQAFILPVAVAAVLTYLLAPLVDKLRARGVAHKKAALIVFLGFLVGGGVLIACIAVPVASQFSQLGQSMPAIYKNFEKLLEKNLSPDGLAKLVADWEKHPLGGPLIKMTPFSTEAQLRAKEKAGQKPGTGLFDVPPVPNTTEPPYANGAEKLPAPDAEADASAATGTSEDGPAPTPGADGLVPLPGLPTEEVAPGEEEAIPPPQNLNQIRDWLAVQIPLWAKRAWEGLLRSIGGVLGAFGFILNFLLVPIYLFFFLRETHSIQANWSDYLPIRASRFKDEIVDLVQEVNGYLIAFFRGQMLVSLIDGFFTALILSVVGLKFGLLIGVLVGILGIIPYIGLMVCLVPAVIIAIVQTAQGDWHLFGIQHPAWWVLPLIVVVTFFLVNNLDGMLIAPKIVGDSVGLHPLMIIASVIFWSLVLGGLLGALLAVPLTATGQVLFRRYIWQRQRNDEGGPPPEPLAPGDTTPSDSTAIIPAPSTEIIVLPSPEPAPAPAPESAPADSASTPSEAGLASDASAGRDAPSR